MNKQLEDYARQKIKEGLSKLSEGHQLIFRRMYSQKTRMCPEISINEVVDNMRKEKLDWALTQVQNSLNKMQKEKKEGEENARSN